MAARHVEASIAFAATPDHNLWSDLMVVLDIVAMAASIGLAYLVAWRRAEPWRRDGSSVAKAEAAPETSIRSEPAGQNR